MAQQTEVPVNMDIDNELWLNAKIQAIKTHKLLKTWIAEAIQEKLDRENLPQ
jgi:hypothetical protein